MNEASNHTAFFRGLRQTFGVTLILLFLCGLLFPRSAHRDLCGSVPGAGWRQSGLCGWPGCWIQICWTGIHQALFREGDVPPPTTTIPITRMRREINYHDGSPFAGVASGSNNYAPSNPALVQRVRGRCGEIPRLKPGCQAGGHSHRPDDGLRLRTGPHISPASAAIQLPAIAEASGLSQETLKQIVEDNTQETSGDLRGRDGQCSRRQPGHCPGDGPDKH